MISRWCFAGLQFNNYQSYPPPPVTYMESKEIYLNWIKLAEHQFRLACTVHLAVINGVRAPALAMVFKLIEAAQKSWRCLDGHNQLPKLITGVKVPDGIEVVKRRCDFLARNGCQAESKLATVGHADVAARRNAQRVVSTSIPYASSKPCATPISLK